MNLLNILIALEVFFGIILSTIILIQPKKSSLNLTTFGNEGGGKFERRGAEKTLHNATIFFGILFIATSVVYFFMA